MWAPARGSAACFPPFSIWVVRVWKSCDDGVVVENRIVIVGDIESVCVELPEGEEVVDFGKCQGRYHNTRLNTSLSTSIKTLYINFDMPMYTK